MEISASWHRMEESVDTIIGPLINPFFLPSFLSQVKINTILARYLFSGHLDHLKHKWYGELLCSGLTADIYKPQVRSS